MENLWKSFNNILWTTDNSAIGRIEICGDPDSAIGRKKPKRMSPGATVLDKITVRCVSSLALWQYVGSLAESQYRSDIFARQIRMAHRF